MSFWRVEVLFYFVCLNAEFLSESVHSRRMALPFTHYKYQKFSVYSTLIHSYSLDFFNTYIFSNNYLFPILHNRATLVLTNVHQRDTSVHSTNIFY